jgi:hypothetical protein
MPNSLANADGFRKRRSPQQMSSALAFAHHPPQMPNAEKMPPTPKETVAA